MKPGVIPSLLPDASVHLPGAGPLPVSGPFATSSTLKTPRLVNQLESGISSIVLITRWRQQRAFQFFEIARPKAQGGELQNPACDHDYLLMMAQGYQESGLDQHVRSSRGAVGIMQVMPATGRELNVVGDIHQLESTMGWTVGVASVLLAVLLAFPLSFVFERGGNSIGGPAILHTSSNAPVILLALPEEFIATALLPHMGVVLVSLYSVFIVHRFLVKEPPAAIAAK